MKYHWGEKNENHLNIYTACTMPAGWKKIKISKEGWDFSSPSQLSIYCLSASYTFTLYYLICKNRHGPLKFFLHLLFSEMLSFVRRCWKDTVGRRCGSWFCSAPLSLPPAPVWHLSYNSFVEECLQVGISPWTSFPGTPRGMGFQQILEGGFSASLPACYNCSAIQ